MYCADDDCIDGYIDESKEYHPTSEDRDDLARALYEQILHNNVCLLPACDGLRAVHPRGVPPGLSTATVIFNSIYDKTLRDYEKETKEQSTLVMAYSPFDGQLIDLSQTSFVDDLGKCSIKPQRALRICQQHLIIAWKSLVFNRTRERSSFCAAPLVKALLAC